MITTESVTRTIEDWRAEERKRNERLRNAIRSERYEVLELVGRGSWGEVYKVRDKVLSKKDKDEFKAIKICKPTEAALAEAQRCNINPLNILRDEALDLKLGSHIVPRRYEEDDNGQPMLVMPFYQGTLHNFVQGVRWYSANHQFQFNKEGALDGAKQLVEGIAELHGNIGIVHGDWKPENILHNKGQLLVTDFSLNQVARTITPQDDRGHRYTRAPECFSRKGKHGKEVDPRADVFGNAALIYWIYTGKYPLEEEMYNLNPKEYGDFIESLGIKGGSKLIRKGLKDKSIPRDIETFLSQALSFDPQERFADGVEMKRSLDEILSDHSIKGSLVNGLIKSCYIGIPLLGIATIIGCNNLTKQPDYSVPQIKMVGTINPNFVGTNTLELTRESLRNLPDIEDTAVRFSQGRKYFYDRIAEGNAYVGFFAETYFSAFNQIRNHAGGLFGKKIPEKVTAEQREMWQAYTPQSERSGLFASGIDIDERIIAASIRVALSESKTSDGVVKLEDVCTIGYVGQRKLNDARKAANSFLFAKYITAKDRNGNYIISELEQNMITMWISHVNDLSRYSIRPVGDSSSKQGTSTNLYLPK